MDIYLIRHGRQCQTACNVNVALSDAGHRQAKLVAKRLQNYHIQGLYASELIRARQTAEHISTQLHLPVITMPDIQEIDFGDWQGKEDEELDARYGEMRRAYEQGLEDVEYPHGESGRTCYERYRKGLENIIADARQKGYTSIAVVTHGAAMRSFLCGEFNIPFKRRAMLAKSLENCSITQLKYSAQYGYCLERFNDYAHLEPYDELLRKHFK